jgi:HAD superfamily hydrolase (TIGR01509 family)
VTLMLLNCFRLRAVIFDMDGLMLDTERLAREAWYATMRAWGYNLTDEVYLQVLGTTGERTRRIFEAAFGDDIPIDAMYDYKQRLIDRAIASGEIAVKPGLLTLLDQLDTWGMPKAVASSTARALVLRKLDAVGLVDRFNAIVGGDEVAHGKPAPDVFVEAARRLGVPASACAVLEDSDNGIRAAHGAGALAIMVPDLQPPDADTAALAWRVVPSLTDALALLRALHR